MTKLSPNTVLLEIYGKGGCSELSVYIFLSTSPIHSYSSGILNFIEAKIKNTQGYVLSKEKYNPYHISDGEPGLKAGEVWL